MTGVSLSWRRILALDLGRFPTDRLCRRRRPASSPSRFRPDATGPEEHRRPLAVFAAFGNALRLVAVDAAAEAAGLVAGQTVAEARARVPDLDLAERDPAGEAADLGGIADWCDRWTPLVGFDGFDDRAGLLLDIDGVDHLFGGESAMAAEIVRRLTSFGVTATAAVAGSPAAARAVARHGLGDAAIRVVAPGDDRAAVAPLPIAAIDPDRSRVAGLARLGLKRVGDLLDRPRAGLTRRFGRDLLDRLDEAAGALDRPIVPRRPVPRLAVERRTAEPLPGVDDCLAVLASLAETLAEGLERRGEGLRRAELTMWRVDGHVVRSRIGTGRPCRDPRSIVRLFEERLKRDGADIDPGFGFDLVRLSALTTAPHHPAQTDFSGEDDGAVDFDRLIDRLGARLGAARLAVAAPGGSHLPERAAIHRSADGDAPGSAWEEPADDDPPARPLRLLPRPEPIEAVAALPDGAPLRFRWRRALYEVERVEGPERIAPEWWRSSPTALDPEAEERFDPAIATRDYFRVEERAGRRFWIFRAGLFGRETIRPRWYLHGLFG